MARLQGAFLIAAALAGLQLPLAHAQAKDPINNFCRRWGHQTAVVDRRLYIDGGMLTWNPMSQNPNNYTNTWLLYNDLDVTANGMPQLHDDLNKTQAVPDLSGGILWADEVNKVLYLYGGEYTNSAAEAFQPWAYDIVLNQWNRTDVAPATGIQRVSYGAGATVNETGVGYWLGGWLNNQTVPGWGGQPMLTSNLVTYDMIGDTWTNSTGPDQTGRGEGVMVYIPASDRGLLVYFGGVIDPFDNGTITGDALSNIYVYDIASNKWYKQTAGGDVPDMRRKFCGGATWAQDRSSYNIYIYGGQGITNTTGYDDVYILTLPSFQWIKWYPTEPGPGNPHGILSCNVIDNSQMLIIGGWFAQHQDCDSPNVWGTHNLNLGKNGPEDAMWDLFYPNITQYLVPPEIVAKIGGSSTGGATNKAPSSWDNRDLPVYFSRVPTYSARTATRAIPTSTGTSTSGSSGGSSDSDTGAIVGGVVGGVGGLLVILAIVWFCLRRRKRNKNDPKRKKDAEEKPPAELPADDMNGNGGVISELSATQSHRYRKGEAGHSPTPNNLSPIYTHASASPHSPSMGFPSPATPYTPGGPPGMLGGYMQPPVSPNSPQYMYPAGPPGTLPQYMYPHPPPNAQPYDPSQHALHNEHFPPPPSPQPGSPQAGLVVPGRGHNGASTPSDYSRDLDSDPPTSTNTPAHFYPQPLSVPPRHVSQSTHASDTPLVGRISESIGSVSGSGSEGGHAPFRNSGPPLRGRFREEGHDY